jgi:hypothetical protein
MANLPPLPGRFRRWGSFVSLLLAACFLVNLSAKASLADPQQPDPAESQDSLVVPENLLKSMPRIRYVGPDTYILLDAEGKPVPVPGVTFEDFMKAWTEGTERDVSSGQPRYIIERVQITGTAGRNAELNVRVEIKLIADEPVDNSTGAARKGSTRIHRRSDPKAS